MENVTFIAAIWNTGHSRVITIPAHLIKHGILHEGELYNVTLKKRGGTNGDIRNSKPDTPINKIVKTEEGLHNNKGKIPFRSGHKRRGAISSCFFKQTPKK